VFLQQWRKAWSYSTPRVFEEFQQKFLDFQGTEPTTCPESLQMRKTCFWKQVVFCAKKAVDERQKDQLKILKRVNKELLPRLTQETNLSFGAVQLILKKDLHFFLYRVSVVDEITP
jgi:hypothetical protein